MSTEHPENLFAWSDEYALNIPEIDAQHRALLEKAGELHALVATNAPDSTRVHTLIEEILTGKAEHFATEERYFHADGYAGTEEHEQAHRSFSKHIDDLREKYTGDENRFAEELVTFLAHWFVNHLRGVDQKYIPYFAEHQFGTAS